MLSINENCAEEKNYLKLFNQKLNRVKSVIGFEATIWLLGFLYLIFIHNPGDTHFTICPLANLGIEICPGCGLGNSISYLFRGDFFLSFHSHPLGILALIIITTRIITIIKNNRRKYA